MKDILLEDYINNLKLRLYDYEKTIYNMHAELDDSTVMTHYAAQENKKFIMTAIEDCENYMTKIKVIEQLEEGIKTKDSYTFTSPSFSWEPKISAEQIHNLKENPIEIERKIYKCKLCERENYYFPPFTKPYCFNAECMMLLKESEAINKTEKDIWKCNKCLSQTPYDSSIEAPSCGNKECNMNWKYDI